MHSISLLPYLRYVFASTPVQPSGVGDQLGTMEDSYAFFNHLVEVRLH